MTSNATVHTALLLAGPAHGKRMVVPELDREWNSAAPPRIRDLVIGDPGQIAWHEDRHETKLVRSYAIVGRCQSGEIIAVHV